MKFVLPTTLLLMFLVAPVASACSCAAPPPPKKALEQAQAVFVAKVTKIQRSDLYGNMVTMEISTTWKGTKGKVVTVQTGFGGGDCGYTFQVGKSYLVYAYRVTKEDDEEVLLGTNVCTRTRLVEGAKADIDALGPAKMPPV